MFTFDPSSSAIADRDDRLRPTTGSPFPGNIIPASGKYTCQVSVLEPSTQKFAVWRSAMVLLP
jgi:hypothetical protein